MLHVPWMTPAAESDSVSHNTVPLKMTYIDSRISLDVVHVGVGQTELLAAPLGRADDARSDGVAEGKGAAHGHDKLPLPDI